MLAAGGITTMYHCVAFVYDDARLRSLRSNDQAMRILGAIRRLAPELTTHTRVHVRYDILNTGVLPVLRESLAGGKVDLLSFMDHTPGQGQFRDVEAYKRHMVDGYRQSPEQVDRRISDRRSAREAVSDAALEELAELCVGLGIPLASHDDDSAEKVSWAARLGVTLCEFPINLEALEQARRLGVRTALGSPNVLLGRSQSGNLSAREVMACGYGDILCSDYSPMSLIHAVHVLRQSGAFPLHEVAKLVTLHPAQAAGIDSETGSIEPGKRADVILLDDSREVPRIWKTFVAGREVYSTALPGGN